MRNFYLLFSTFLIVSFSEAQKIDTSYTYAWWNNSWEINNRGLYSYNSNCQLDSTLYQSVDQTTKAWINSTLVLTIYAPLQEAQVTKFWQVDSNSWKNISRT